MFIRKHFDILREAINMNTAETTSTETTMKAGLRQNLYHLIVKASKIIWATHLKNKDDDTAREVDYFEEVLKLHKNIVFGDATYILNQNC